MEAYDAIQNRSSCRKYRAEQITGEQLDALLKAANAAPVGMGDYKSFGMIPYCGASCIAENIMIQASALNLGSVYIMSVPTVMHQKPELLAMLPMTEGFMPVVLVAVGYAETERHGVKADRLRTVII